MPRLERSLSSQSTWAEALARTHATHEPTVAEAFAVIGLPVSTPLQPLTRSGGEELVLSNLCLVSATEIKPEGFEVVTETPCGQRAVLSAGGAVTVFLAQCLRPQSQCSRPITALRLVDVDKGENPPAGFVPVDCTTDAERGSFGAQRISSTAQPGGDRSWDRNP